MSAAQTGLVRSPSGDWYIEPKSPSLNSVPPMPGTNARAGPPDTTLRTGGVKSASASRSYSNCCRLTSSPAASA
jgi:hypothetical protein